jgi:hypothetical protein
MKPRQHVTQQLPPRTPDMAQPCVPDPGYCREPPVRANWTLSGRFGFPESLH